MRSLGARFLGQGKQYGPSPLLRVGNVMLPISNAVSADSTLYACSNSAASSLLDKLAGMQATPEPPVIKVRITRTNIRV
jgi:hypothetical protein